MAHFERMARRQKPVLSRKSLHIKTRTIFEEEEDEIPRKASRKMGAWLDEPLSQIEADLAELEDIEDKDYNL